MPRIHPQGWRELPARGAGARRIDTLHQLHASLPENCTVFHGVHWTREQGAHSVFGHIDFVIIGADATLVLLQQIDGLLEESEQGLVRHQLRRPRMISSELAHDAQALRTRLKQQPELGDVEPRVLLYCPDYRLREPGSAGLAPENIVDASRREALGRIIAARLAHEAAAPERRKRLERFFADTLQLVPEVNALVSQAEALYTRLSGGLAQWARQLRMRPFRLRVTGTAGSGKTQLALAVLNDAARQGQRALYVCYNRPLADHMARIAPGGSDVVTYHQLCDRTLRAHGRPPDFSQPHVFTRAEEDFATLPVPPAQRVDVLIVDEGQDFRAEWFEALCRRLHPEGQAWWLEDPSQNLYDRPETSLPGWVQLCCHDNHRSPADVQQWLATHLPLEHAVRSVSPLQQSGVEVLLWDDENELFRQTRRAITRVIGLGFAREHLALITFRGREHSLFSALDRLGAHALRRFTGRYDLLGSPEYSEGDVLIESVSRFKGQAAPAIVFTEIDFTELDARSVRKLFVGATRASMKLVLVMSKRAARQLGVTAHEQAGTSIF